MGPIFTDKEVRDLMNVYKWRAQDREDGSDTREYVLCKAIRDAVEDRLKDEKALKVDVDGYIINPTVADPEQPMLIKVVEFRFVRE